MNQISSSGRGSGGGAATQAGINFQNRVAAWVATRILCDRARSPIFGLAEIPCLLRCETEQPVDDLLVGSRSEGFAFVQVKHSVDLSDSPTSVLAEVVAQFARQILGNRGGGTVRRPWDRKPNPDSDALVLVVGPGSSGQIREHLRNVLIKVRQLLPQQSVTDAASNGQEARALNLVCSHFSRSYRVEVGDPPSETELRGALRLMYIEVLDVDPSGQGEREARDALREVVLRDHGEAASAWATLVNACARMAELHSGADQGTLQKLLLEAGFELNVPSSYRSDIDQLRKITEKTRNQLSDLAKIKVAEATISINRAVTQEIQRLAEITHTLVVGEPGAGKSGALAYFLEGLEKQSLDFVALAVDHLDAATESQLEAELRLEHGLDEILDNWAGRRPAFLVIDALDAARGGPGAKTIRDLIGRISRQRGRWRVVASIRKFDLRYSEELQGLFSMKEGTKAEPEFRDDHFSTVCHVNVRPLSEKELADVQTQSPILGALISRAPAELQKLLRIPFNLRLLGELLGSGMSLEQLTPIRTQLDLLDKYWSKRVIGEDNFGYAREDILRRACEGMASARMLRVDLAIVSGAAGSPSLHSLLSSQVLVEWEPALSRAANRYVLAFSHHVLFDYSAARLLLRGNRGALVQRVEKEPELCLILRPSFVFHFQHLWNEESVTAFWEFVFETVRSSQVPEIGKLIGPSTAVDLVTTILDFEPLIGKLSATGEAERRLGEQVFQHLIGAVLVAPRDMHPLVGTSAGPWAGLAEQVSRNLHHSSAYSLRSLLSAACDFGDGWTVDQLAALGAASRRLLAFAWASDSYDEWLVALSMQCVCRTFDSDREASAAMLRRALVLDHLQSHGYAEMPWLAREVHRLIRSDPALVEDIYVKIFQFREDSDDPTAMSSSRILRLSGNRKQDYGMARFELAEIFPTFQAEFPENATRVAIAAVEGYVREERSLPLDAALESFEFRGRLTWVLTDYSSIWDGRMYARTEDSIRILDSFMRRCETLLEEGRVEGFGRILDVVIEHNHLAVFWRRLLGIAAKHPGELALALAPVANAIPILKSMDTSDAVGEYLRVCFPMLPVAERESIERTIVSLPETSGSDHRESLERTRNRLLGCIGLKGLITSEAKAIFTSLAEEEIPKNELPVHFGRVYSGVYGEREYLSGQGVNVESTANIKIQQLEQPVVAFGAKFLNSNPTVEDVQTALPILRALHEALRTAENDGVDAKQSDYAWGVLAEGAERITKFKDLTCDEGSGQFVKEVLLAASWHPNPEPTPEGDAHFDESCSWGGPSARISAAQGLTALGGHPMCATTEVLEAIERLSQDPVAAVRFQVVGRLVHLYRTDQALMWKIIRRIMSDDTSNAVVSALLQPTIGQISGAHPQEVAELIREVLSSKRRGTGVRSAGAGILCGLYVWQEHSLSGELLDVLISAPIENAELLSQLQFNLRDLLTYGGLEKSEAKDHAIRKRALKVFGRVVDSVKSGARELEQANSGLAFDDWSEIDRENVKRLVQLLDHAAKEIYFSSGAFDSRRQNSQSGQRDRTVEERKRFFEESAPIINALSDLGFPSIAHHLVQTLESFVSFEPRRVFLTIGIIVRAGVAGGYQFEQLAADLVVRLVERYIAEYREMLQEDPECRQVLMELLDTFIRAGWAGARQLTYRLEDIFR